MLARYAVLSLVLAAAASADAATIVKVQGRIVDAGGNPVAGARIAAWWFAEEAGGLEPERPVVVSAKDGRFALEVEMYGRDVSLMAVDATGTLGGLATVSAKGPAEPLEIRLAPLVETRGRYVSETAERALGRTYVSWSVGDNGPYIAGARSRRASFAVKLPPGRYTLSSGESRHEQDVREIALEPERPGDLGEIRLPLTPIAKLAGKLAPAWHVTDARGVSKEVQPADFKGKWVVLEFWGYWCGPCISRGLPGWVDFADAHSADSDKFVVLAVHDPQATDFAMLDAKLEPIIHRTWRGRPLPFPILLDTSGEFVRDYGIRGWPTAVLLDPEGRVVDVPEGRSWVFEDFLASKLTPLPIEKRLARSLDRGLSLAVDERPLGELLSFYSDISGAAIRLDADELRAVGIDAKTEVSLKASGTLTLRAWLNLALEPFGLTHVADGDSLRVVRRTPENGRLSQSSAKQTAENALVVETLQKKVTFDFQGESLKQVIASLDTLTDETFVLDPAGRKAGTIDPNRTITGSATDEPLSAALTRLLSPLGLKFVVRDEAVVITAGR